MPPLGPVEALPLSVRSSAPQNFAPVESPPLVVYKLLNKDLPLKFS